MFSLCTLIELVGYIQEVLILRALRRIFRSKMEEEINRGANSVIRSSTMTISLHLNFMCDGGLAG
jgi:hypothetical protein